MTNDQDAPSSDDGRSLWWMIPAAVASVLGIAAATIVRTRRQHEVQEGQAVAALPAPSDPAPSAPPLADLPPDSPAPG